MQIILSLTENLFQFFFFIVYFKFQGYLIQVFFFNFVFTLFFKKKLLNFFYVKNLILLVIYILLLNSNFLMELNEILKLNKFKI